MIATNKRATESFLVNLAGTTTMPTSGTLSNSSTGAVNLTNGQLGLISASQFGTVAMNSFTDATPTFAENPVIQIVQGTPYSASILTSSVSYPLWVRPYEISNKINGIDSKSILVTKQAFRAAKHNIWTVGVPSTTATGGINALDETEYRMYIGFRSRRFEETYSREIAAGLRISKITPAFSTNTGTYPLPVDWIATQFAFEINRNSEAFLLTNRFQGSDPVVAFCVGLINSGPSGAAAGIAISGLTLGSVVPVFVYNGVTRNLTLTQEMADSIIAAGTASGFTYLLPCDLSQAGTTTGGTATGIFIMALDSKQAYVDYIPQLKNRLRVALNAGFNYQTVSNLESVNADEGQGYGRTLDLWYKATQGQRKYAQRHTLAPVIEFPSPVDTTQQYVTYTIHHGNSMQVDTFNMVYSPYREIVLLPRYSSGTTTNALISTWDTTFNVWLASVGAPAIAALD